MFNYPSVSYRLSMIILVIFTVTSCKTVNVEKPAETYQYEKAELQPSLIGFSAEAKLSDIQKELNREFTDWFTKTTASTITGVIT